MEGALVFMRTLRKQAPVLNRNIALTLENLFQIMNSLKRLPLITKSLIGLICGEYQID